MRVFNIRIKTNGVGPYSANHVGRRDTRTILVLSAVRVYTYNIAVCKFPGTVFTDGIFHPCAVVIYHPGAYLESLEARARGAATPSVWKNC